MNELLLVVGKADRLPGKPALRHLQSLDGAYSFIRFGHLRSSECETEKSGGGHAGIAAIVDWDRNSP
jgi:hypothetical protein